MRSRPVSLQRQILFWGLGLGALLLIVYLLGSTIMPFAAGIVLAISSTRSCSNFRGSGSVDSAPRFSFSLSLS